MSETIRHYGKKKYTEEDFVAITAADLINRGLMIEEEALRDLSNINQEKLKACLVAIGARPAQTTINGRTSVQKCVGYIKKKLGRV